ncbi:MAG: Gfo/Idh/MocA family oxidoreductase, partial [Acidobacteria bacterium]|nr:Gfo/Idh/MocA family oxidoreductase [Acidobacteriota bacterium]
DRDQDRLRYLEGEFGLKKIGRTDYRECFEGTDAVILALPNHLHEQVGVEFLRRGIHVLCEKPLARTPEECRSLCNAAEASKAVLAVGFLTRFFPSTKLTKELLQQNFLGRLQSFDYEFGTDGGWSPFSGYNLSRAESGGGVLVVSGSHFLDRMLYLLGDARVVSYADDSRGGVEANAVAVFEVMANGSPLRGQVTLSKTRNLANRLRIVGEKGSLEVGEGQKGSVYFYPAGGTTRHEITYAAEGIVADYFAAQLDDFAHAVRNGTPPMVTGEEATRSVAITEECYRRVTPLEEPWASATLDRLRAALPPDTTSATAKGETEPASGVVHAT